ncbi:MAG: sensor histidine kinase [Vicingus serpentipes]|nr:sensor histidine kinase [Vicingus serpentipes]
MAWRLSLVISIVLFVLSVVVFVGFTNIVPTIIVFSIFLISVFAFVYLKITQNFIAVFWMYVITGTIGIHTGLNTVLDIPHYGDFLWIIAILLLAFITLGEKIGITFAIIHFLAIAFFYYYTVNKHLEVIQPRTISDNISDIIDNALSFFVIIYLVKQKINLNEYTENQLLKVNSSLKQKNKENSFLLKEIHHRVKNNLQIIISLLRLQKEELTEEQSKKSFDGAVNRIMTMSLIHKKLYQTKELSTISIKAYIEELVQEIVASISTSKLTTNIKTNAESIGLNTIVPFGLLINELISNSIKHAFSNKDEWIIDVNINKINESEFELIYKDNGEWKEPQTTSKQFGLGLIETLTDQLEGTMNRVGSSYNFTLKNLDI